ncbi:uncharacterized protein LOC117784217 isoform X2 [Drosophila innubila]|uniref:uncharacterized protein LOC117784217 isoform X2 n=1 Tax=Drosophila innubila TaxID=198719 RepID=UPI00148C2F48|nr:uncharacterized protein LOC117784217 isoform X2 [Drosophila innubila]
MTGIELWGIGIAVLNVMYSFAYLGPSIGDYFTADEGDILPWVWILVYTCNAALNTYFFLRMLKSDLIAILLWLSFTCMLLLFRLFGIHYGKVSSTYKILAIAVNVYIFITLIIMGVVYKKLNNSKEEPVNNPPAQPWGAVNRTGKTVSSSVNRTVAYNTNESISFITQSNLYAERNGRNNGTTSGARTAGHMASNAMYYHDNSFLNCCDNTADDTAGCLCDDNGNEGGCDGCDGGGDGGGYDGGGCDGGGGDDGGGCDGGGDGGGDCGGGSDD